MKLAARRLRSPRRSWWRLGSTCIAGLKQTTRVVQTAHRYGRTVEVEGEVLRHQQAVGGPACAARKIGKNTRDLSIAGMYIQLTDASLL